jgi:hypothetical protein
MQLQTIIPYDMELGRTLPSWHRHHLSLKTRLLLSGSSPSAMYQKETKNGLCCAVPRSFFNSIDYNSQIQFSNRLHPVFQSIAVMTTVSPEAS